MDTKKLILAIILSVAVLLVYQYFFMPKPVARPQAPVAETAAPEQPAAAATGEPAGQEPGMAAADIGSFLGQGEPAAKEADVVLPAVPEDLAAQAEQPVMVDGPLFAARFTNRGAGLVSFVLKKYKDDAGKPMDLVSLKAGDFSGFYPFYFLVNDEVFGVLNKALFSYRGEMQVQISGRRQTEVVFEYADAARNLLAVKKFIFSPDSYMIGLKFEVIRNGRPLADLPVVFGPDLENNDSRDRAMMMNLKIAAYANEKLESIDFAKLKTLPQAGQAFEKAAGEKGSGYFWAAYETTYFAAVFKSAPQNRSKLSYQAIRHPQGKEPAKLYSYMVVTDPVAAFIGPKDEKVLAAVEKEFPDLNKIIEYGWFGSIAKIMLKGIVFIHGFLPNYGWAIILFTLFLKLILFPLTYSSSVSMAKMQSLQPKMKAIKKKYKNTKDMEQRKLMNMEMMALYKQEKVNPAGGCLPLLLQLPLLWGFFRLLSVSINVRHEPWMLWITDLSKKDPYYVLPILMGVTQLIQTRMQPAGGDEMQKKMMYILPFVMVIMFASFPSGLNLYWTFSNILQIGQQYIVNEKIHKEKKDEEREIKALKRKKGAKEK
ncbi:MAG: membrane protein insertase YidC [Acidobacteria bacterium]|jgi:YidC/Oxa1 family membrane protein insertase|nr:membrane protein insertase YidC [Acidobacteriota bacterium]